MKRYLRANSFHTRRSERTPESMNAVLRQRENEVDVGNIEATEAKIDALRDSLDEVKEDVRELRGDIHSLRDKVDKNHGEMHAGFATLRECIARVETSVAELRGMLKAMIWAIGGIAVLATLFFTAGKALHWF